MLKTKLWRLAFGLALAIATASARADFSVASNHISFTPGVPFTFNFGSGTGVGADHQLLALSLYAEFTPGALQTTTMNVDADLQLLGYDGSSNVTVNPHLSIDTSVLADIGASPTSVVSLMASSSGLSYSDLIVGAIIQNSGSITGMLSTSNVAAWNDFFANGGTASLSMVYSFSGDPHNTVPEPASLLLWGSVLAGGAFVRRRRRNTVRG